MKAVSVRVRGSKPYTNEWANKLHRALERWGDFEEHVCLTDDPRGLETFIRPIDIGPWWREIGTKRGHWAKVYLHKPGLFDDGERLFFSDIDNLIIGDLAPLLNCEGFTCAPHTAPNFRPTKYEVIQHFSSAVMCWTHGGTTELFTDWEPSLIKRFHGDQDWFGSKRPEANVWDRRHFGRGTKFLDCEPVSDVRVVFCTKIKNDEFVKRVGWAREHWR